MSTFPLITERNNQVVKHNNRDTRSGIVTFRNFIVCFIPDKNYYINVISRTHRNTRRHGRFLGHT